MQILKQLKVPKKLKKSHTLLFGSLLIFMGVISLSWNYLVKVREGLFADMKIAMMDTPEPVNPNGNDNITPDVINEYNGENNRYNNIKYNVAMVEGTDLPDVPQGNLILMAHSGDSYISFFAYLYKLEIGDDCYVTYNGGSYHYQIVNIYEVVKNGVVSIRRDKSKNTLTLITCTKDNNETQTIYIAELIE